MSDSPSPGNANPLDAGANPNSVETAAADFSAMLQDEGRRDRHEAREPRREARPSPARKADDSGEGDDGQPQRQPARERREPADEADDGPDLHDPILDGEKPAKPKGKEEDDQEGEGADEPESDEPDENDEPDEDDEGDDDEDPFLTSEREVTVNGQTVKVTGAELLAGYSREADYRQKTDRVAREYREVEEFAATAAGARKQSDENLQFALATMEALAPSKEDWDAMERDNPQGYIAAQKHWQTVQAKAREIVDRLNKSAEDGAKIGTHKTDKYFRDQETALIEKLPSLRDSKNANAFRKSVMEYGLANGYSEQELKEGATDHRDLITLYKAARYDELQKSVRAAGRKGAQKGPKQSETRAAPPPKATRERRSRLNEADRRLARTGSVQDAASSFAEMIRGESR